LHDDHDVADLVDRGGRSVGPRLACPGHVVVPRERHQIDQQANAKQQRKAAQ
jgi:hypothetical protein